MIYFGNAVTDVGRVKAVNQDSLALKIANTSQGMVCLAIVCDGLGGLQYGEVASACVISAFDAWFKQYVPDLGGVQTEAVIEQTWKELLFFVNKKLVNYGVANRAQLGTTVTAVLFIEDKYYAVHVGDSRMYKLGTIVQQITRDHTANEYAKEHGQSESTTVLQNSNVLWQCVGVNEQIQPDFIVGDVEDGCTYLLCSDGFRHLITNKEIYEKCNSRNNNTADDIKDNLRYLIDLNMERGERDNISAILVKASQNGV